MRFSLITLHVKDMEASLALYHTLLEMPVVRKQAIGPGKELVFLGRPGDVNLELIPSDGAVVHSGAGIGFEVENLPKIKERLAAGGYVIKREFSPDLTTTLCFLDGPDGEQVELISMQ